MKNSFIISQNLRGWPLNSKKYCKALDYMADYMNHSSVILVCLQEYVFGKNEFYHMYFNSKLQGDWACITPKGYNKNNWRSAINVIYVRRRANYFLQMYNVLSLNKYNPRPDYADLYNYVDFTFLDKKSGITEEFKIINIHNINRYNPNKPAEYALRRLSLAAELWHDLHEIVIHTNTLLYVVGDNNAGTGDPDFDQLINEGLYDSFNKKSKWKSSYVDRNGLSRRYDHILLNENIGYSLIDPEIYIKKISDHCSICYFKEENIDYHSIDMNTHTANAV